MLSGTVPYEGYFIVAVKLIANGHYPLKTWNYYQIEGPKTNNHVEGWHNKINRAAGKAHPNIFELVELFKTEQANTEVCLACTVSSRWGSEKHKEEVLHKTEKTW